MLLALSACVSTEDSVIPRQELRASSAPNIKLLHLTDGRILVFNSDLGWYDAGRGYVEGIAREDVGSELPSEYERDTIPVNDIRLAEVRETHANTFASILAAIGIMSLAFVIAVVAYWSQIGARSGCAFVLAGLVTAASMLTAVLILVQP